MKRFNTLFCFLVLSIALSAKTYFIAVNGSDSNKGTIDSPFATLNKAQSLVEAGDTVFIRKGTYKITEDQIMNTRNSYACVFDMAKSGLSSNQRIYYWGYQDERPVFDLSAVKPEGLRVSVFYVTGNYLHFKNFEVIGTQVTIVGHTQSECFSNRGGSNNIYEFLTMRDGMAIGFYLTQGSNNLVLNCDAYNNYDTVSDGGRGGNVDGFGGHTTSAYYTGNVFRGCRAWYNSDDGFDLINSQAAYVIDNCWAFYNGYQPGTFNAAGDGTGFKAGGYGMSNAPKAPEQTPQHKVINSLAYYNKNKGFYANHHLGGIAWYNNTGYKNPSNYCMLNRKSATEAVDVPGYGHILRNNLSYAPRSSGKHIVDVDESRCQFLNNSFLPLPVEITEADFISIDDTQLTLPRKADGSLPDITFLKVKEQSPLFESGMGYFVPWEEEVVENYDWLQEATIVATGKTARLVGPGAEEFTRFFINNIEVKFTDATADLSLYSGQVVLKATTTDGSKVARLIINR